MRFYTSMKFIVLLILVLASSCQQIDNDNVQWIPKQRKHPLVVISTFKNEGDVISEWLDHHIEQEVSHFYLIDNGSTDDSQQVLTPYIERGIVTVIYEPTRHAQAQTIGEHLLPLVRNYANWVLSIDLDEYVYATNAPDTLLSILRRLPSKVSAVVMRWRLFGSSGLIQQPSSVRRSFTRCAKGLHALSKWVARTDALSGGWDCHWPSINHGVVYDGCSKAESSLRAVKRRAHRV